jgi:hypothetical protein
MRAILLENDILIAEAWDIQWSENDGFAFHSSIPMPGRGREPKYEQEFSFRCEIQFLKNFYLGNSEKGKLTACLLICEDLSHKYLYGLKPKSIEYDDFYCKIDFSIDYFLSEENISDDFNIENKWLKHNRNKRIDEILES